MDMFSNFLISAKFNDITNISVKSILVHKIAYTSMYDIIMSPEDFEMKKKTPRNCALIDVKNRHLSTASLNVDCSRVWQ